MDSVLEVGGYATAGTSILLQISTTLEVSDVNPYITAATGIAGFVFLVYKIINLRVKSKNDKLDNKIKQIELEKRIAEDN